MSDGAARILVVDDVPENVRLLEAVLEAHGYDGRLGDATASTALELVDSASAGSRAARRDDAAAWTATRSAGGSASRRRRPCCR